MMSEHTIRKKERILKFIEDYIQREKIVPTVREICNALEIRSTSTVHRYLHMLEQEGAIQIKDGKKRAISVSESRETKNSATTIPVIQYLYDRENIFNKKNIEGNWVYDMPETENPLFCAYLSKDFPEYDLYKGDLVLTEVMTDCHATQKVVVLNKKDNTLEICLKKEVWKRKMLGVAIFLFRGLIDKGE